MRKLLKNLAASAIGLGAALLLIELALVWVIPPPLRYRYPQPYYVVDHELGWLMRPNQHVFTVAWPVLVNSQGFRSPEIAPDKKPNTLRCICFGDSNTFGNAVAQETTFPARLQGNLAAISPGGAEVINAGVGGYDTVQEVGLMERLAPTLKPDVVVIAFYINDVGDVLRIDKAGMVDPATGEFKTHGIKSYLPYRLIYFLKRSRLVTLVYWKLTLLAAGKDWDTEMLLDRTPPPYEKAWKIIEETLRRARQDATSGGYRLILFPVPTGTDFLGEFPHERYRSRLTELARSLGIEYIDPTPVMKAAGGGFSDWFVSWDGHIGARTHDIIARLLAEKIAPVRSAASAHPLAR